MNHKELKTIYLVPACRIRGLWAARSFLLSAFGPDENENYNDRGDDSENWN